VDKFEPGLEPAGKYLYSEVEQVMRRMAYGSWQTMMREYIVRVCVIQYHRRYQTPQDVKRLLRYEISRGFIDMRELDEAVSKYESQRDKYPAFESFFPQVVGFFNEHVKNLDIKESQ
jgi:alpha-galactosidase/6-phospho-beta-glucosidase family protein